MTEKRKKIKCSRSFLEGAQFGVALCADCLLDKGKSPQTYMQNGQYIYKGQRLEFEDDLLDVLSKIKP